MVNVRFCRIVVRNCRKRTVGTPPKREFPLQARARRPTFLLALVAAAACQSDSSSAPSPFTGEPWTLSGPEARIGSVDDPEYVFGPVAALVPGPDGLLYSLHPREGSIRRWSGDDTPSGSVGREGEGPGEFRRPGDMGFFGDSLWVWDQGGFHVSYFDPEGEYLGRVSPEVDFGGPDGAPPRPSRPFRDGSFLGIGRMPAYDIATGELTETAFAHMDAEGEVLKTIWMYPHEPRDGFALLRDGGGSYGSQAFGDGVDYTVADDGLLVTERRAWTGDGEAFFTLTRIGLAGDTVFTVRVPYTPVPLATERIDSAVIAVTDGWYESMSARQPGLAKAALEERIRDATYKPAYVPPVGETMLDADGNIWVRRFDPVELEAGEAFGEWWVFDAGGTPLARALTPMDLRIMHVADDVVWGTEQDEFDVDYIVRYRIVKGL